MSRWDETLGAFALSVAPVLQSRLQLPQMVSLRIRPLVILKSVLGHMVAAKLRNDEVPFDAKIRQFLNGGSLDPSIQVYYWPYSDLRSVVARDFTFVEVVDAAPPSPGLTSVLKFFPLAFCAIDGPGTLREESLHQFAALAEADEADIPVRRFPLVHPLWPERPMGNHLVIGGSEFADAVVASPTESGASQTTSLPGRTTQAERWTAADNPQMGEVHVFASVLEPGAPQVK